ncbi:DHCW motif cupin fold protein [Bacteroidota bacterium]
MNTHNIPFSTIDWSNIPKTEHKGESGVSYHKTIQFQGLRIRIVEYSANYIADHWCELGHIVHCLEGAFLCELKDGTNYTLTKGMTFVVSDDISSHRVTSENRAKVLIIDGDFLSYNPEKKILEL